MGIPAGGAPGGPTGGSAGGAPGGPAGGAVGGPAGGAAGGGPGGPAGGAAGGASGREAVKLERQMEALSMEVGNFTVHGQQESSATFLSVQNFDPL